MKIFGFEIRRAAAEQAAAASGEQRVSPEDPRISLSDPRIVEWLGGTRSAAGVSINETSALTIGAVYTAVRIIAGTIGALPLHVFKREESGRRAFAVRHWAYPLLHDSPNEYHTSIIWRELSLAHLLLWGNAYSRIEWLQNGSARALYPLMPWEVTPKRTDSGTQVYDVRLPDGSRETLPSDEVLHFPGLSYDGLLGMSVISKMRDAAGLAKAAETFGGSFYANGARPGLVLEVPGKIKEDAQAKLTQSVMDKFSGASNAFRAMVLEEGAKLHNVQMPMADAQFLETRKFQRSEIFGWYGIPPHLGGDNEKQTSWGTGIEQMDIGFAKHTITPWLVRLEQEINRKLFGRGSGLYAKFNLDGLMRGDFKSRMEGYRIAVGAPFLTRNEARELEDWNASDDPAMNEVITPLNMGVGAKPETPDTDPAPADPADDPNRAERLATLAVLTKVAERAATPAPAPAINVNAAVNVPESIRHDIEGQALQALNDAAARQVRAAEATRQAAERSAASATEAVRAAHNTTERVTSAMQEVVRAANADRELVLDDNGEPIRSRIVKQEG